jgi:hypothetical protein
MDDGLTSAVPAGGLIRPGNPHIVSMAYWQTSVAREPPKTKTELREMLAQAVRNTQPSADHGPKRLSRAETTTADAAKAD